MLSAGCQIYVNCAYIVRVSPTSSYDTQGKRCSTMCFGTETSFCTNIFLRVLDWYCTCTSQQRKEESKMAHSLATSIISSEKKVFLFLFLHDLSLLCVFLNYFNLPSAIEQTYCWALLNLIITGKAKFKKKQSIQKNTRLGRPDRRNKSK